MSAFKGEANTVMVVHAVESSVDYTRWTFAHDRLMLTPEGTMALFQKSPERHLALGPLGAGLAIGVAQGTEISARDHGCSALSTGYSSDAYATTSKTAHRNPTANHCSRCECISYFGGPE
jgi:hypothetical protein